MMASMYYEDYMRSANSISIGYKLFKNYNDKVKWILKDLLTHPFFPADVREGIRKEVESDVLAIPEISEKLHLLTPKDREFVEGLIESMSNDIPTEYVGSIKIPDIDGVELVSMVKESLSRNLMDVDADVLSKASMEATSVVLSRLIELMGENQFSNAFIEARNKII